MSIKIMTDVWRYSKAYGTPLLVLLALADIADDDGKCWPSIAIIADKCRLKDPRHVRRVIHDTLEEELQEVKVVVEGGKSNRRGGVRSNLYTITVHMPAELQTRVDRPPSENDDPGSETPQTRVDGPPEPSLNRQDESSLVAAPPNRRRTQIPEDFQVTDRHRAWCIEQGIRADPDTERAKFVNHHRAKGTLFADHDAAFRTWMGNADGFSKGLAAVTGQSRNADTITRTLDRIGVTP